MKAKEIKTEMMTGVCDKQNLHLLIESLYGDKFSFSYICTDDGKIVLQLSIAQYYESVVEDTPPEVMVA
jgi:hypothetical protein